MFSLLETRNFKANHSEKINVERVLLRFSLWKLECRYSILVLYFRKKEEIEKQTATLREEVNKLRKENEKLKSGGMKFYFTTSLYAADILLQKLSSSE